MDKPDWGHQQSRVGSSHLIYTSHILISTTVRHTTVPCIKEEGKSLVGIVNDWITAKFGLWLGLWLMVSERAFISTLGIEIT